MERERSNSSTSDISTCQLRNCLSPSKRAQTKQKHHSPDRCISSQVLEAALCPALQALRHACCSSGQSDPLPRGVGSFKDFQDASMPLPLTALLRDKEPLCNTDYAKCPTSIPKGLSEGHSLLSMLPHFIVRRVSPLVELFVQAGVGALIPVILCH